MNAVHTMNAPETDGAPEISIVIPAFNEEAGIGSVLEQLRAVLGRCGARPAEVLVIDDGSTDGTAAVAARESGVRVLRHERNRGYGAALKTGIHAARGRLIGITDADGTYPNERLPDLLARRDATGADMVVAARTGPHARIPLVRRPAKWLIGKLANYVSATAIPDLNSGLRLFDRAVAQRFFDLLPDGFSFTTTITLAMLHCGYRVEYVPVDYHARVGRSKIRPIRDTLNFIHLVLRIALYFAPLKLFLPASIALLGLAIGWGLFTTLVTGRLADVSTLVLAMTGLQVAMTGMLAELIIHRLPTPYGRVAEDAADALAESRATPPNPGGRPAAQASDSSSGAP